MEYKDIKGLDKKVSRLILGTSWMGPDNAKVADQVIEKYIELGGNLLDTAKYYNGFKTEKYLSDWIARNPELRKKIMFTNKACHYRVDENNKHYPDEQRVGAKYIKEDLNHSLNNLGLEYIDLYMMHRDDESFPVDELMDMFQEKLDKGKIKAYGVSNWSLERVKEAEEYCKSKGYKGLSFVSPSYSLCTIEDPRWVGVTYVNKDYVKEVNNLGLPILSWGAQGSGFFGEYPLVTETKVDKNFLRAFETEINMEKRERAKKLAKDKNVSMANIALAYIFNQNLDIFGIVGPRTVKQMEDTIVGESLKLSKDEIEYLNMNDNIKQI